MRAQVPYLARLARQGAGPEALRPPRQLFPGGAYSPAFPAGRPDGLAAAPRDAVPAGPAAMPPRRAEGPSASQPAAARSPRTWPDPLRGTPAEPLPAPAETGHEATAPAGTGGRAGPDGRSGRSPAPATAPGHRNPAPLPQEGASSPAHLAAAQPPRAWPGALWGTPVELPRPAALPLVPGHTQDPRASGPGPGPAAPVPGTGTGRPSGPGRGQQDRGHDSGDIGIRVTSSARTAAAPDLSPAPVTAGAGPSPAPAGAETGPSAAPAARGDHFQVPLAVSDLAPPPAEAPRPATSGTGPAGRLREPRPSGQPQVSIGTIEVTVVPAPSPARELGPKQPPAAAAAGGPRSAGPVAAGMTAGRLQQGLRRWHGIAQG
jgi:hypothetical protein